MGEPVGFVKDIKRSNGQVVVSLVLVHQEVERKAPLLGELVRVQSGRCDSHGRPVDYLGIVLDARYSPIAHKDYDRDLALLHLNNLTSQPEELLDPTAQEQLNFMEFDIALIGVFDREDCHVLHPGVRFLPSLVGAKAYRLDDQEAGELLALKFGHGSPPDKQHVNFGYLAYGTDPVGERRAALKRVSPSVFHSSRTANFGKTGMGKSNENKIIVTLLKYYYPDTAFLIFDANGEYAIRGAAETEIGLAEAFQQLGMKDQLVLFSNRQMGARLEEFHGFLETREVKVNFYQYPEIAIDLAYRRSLEREAKVPQYLEEAFTSVDDWKAEPNRQAYLFGAFRALGLEPHEGLQVKYGKDDYRLDNNEQWNKLQQLLDTKASNTNAEGGSRKLYLYRSRLAFLKPLHTPQQDCDIFAAVSHELFDKKRVVILDMPSLGDLAEFLANRLASKLFERAIENYNRGQKTHFVIILEEAHRYLSDNHNVFYKIAKEGRKFGIGMIYSTQSPRDVPDEVLSQTENFLVKHVSSEEDIKALVKAKASFNLVKDFLLSEPAIGLTYFYSDRDQPFPVSLKVRLLSDIVDDLQTAKSTKEGP